MKSLQLKLGLGVLMAGGAFLLADAWYLEKFFFQTNRYFIGKKNSSKQIRILLLTDLHFKKSIWPFHRKLVRKIKQLSPHLILIPGDIIDEHGTPGPARRFFGMLPRSIPKIAIPGNHDNKNEVSRGKLKKILAEHNGRLLVNETVQLTIENTTITITGLDDFIEGESNFTGAVRGIGKEDHHLLLVHSPLQQEEVLREVQKINGQRTADSQLTLQYIFAGHTHGGQIRLSKLVPFLPEGAGGYVNGWYNNEKPYLYVSKGFGTSTVPFRFGSRSEITVFEYGI